MHQSHTTFSLHAKLEIQTICSPENLRFQEIRIFSNFVKNNKKLRTKITCTLTAHHVLLACKV